MSDVILIYPKTGMDIGSTIAPPHNLLCVAAPLDKAGYKVKIIDQRINTNWRQDLIKELSTNPVFIGIPTMTGTQIKYAMEIARIIRGYNSTSIVWGGPHPTLLPEQILESGLADYVCIGEVDETIEKITNDIYKNKAKPIIRSPLPDVEKLLPTPWHLIDIEQYIHPDTYLKGGRNLDVGQTSRGCPFQCGFCSSASIRERKWRAMSSEKSLEMIGRAIRNFKLTGLWLRDDEFYIDANRAARITEGLIPFGIKYYTSGTRIDVFNKVSEEQVALYKRSGANTLKFGAESGCNRILKLINKGITKEETLEANLKAKRHGIIPAFALMAGFPGETFAEIEKTIDLAKQLKADNPQAQFETMATYTALPGTPMWSLALEYGLRPPQKLEEWTGWNFDEYDPMGKKIPWFNKEERQAIGNLCYLSMLSNALPNVIDSLENLTVSRLLQIGYILPHKYYQWRYFGKHYKHSWELGMVKSLRNKIFYNGYKVWR